MSKKSIEICVQVYSFQKRFWWMLSSLTQQVGEFDSLTIKCNFSETDPFIEMSHNIVNTFSSLLNIKAKFYNTSNFGYRGYTRNFDILESESDWLLFTDADTVFHPEFFSDLKNKVTGGRFSESDSVITVPRLRTDKSVGYDIVDSVSYDSIVENSYKKCEEKSIGYSNYGYAPGAGYFQLVRRKYLQDKDLSYVKNWNRDGSILNKSHTYKADRHFRVNVGNVVSLRNLKKIIHLNHYRHGEEGFREGCL